MAFLSHLIFIKKVYKLLGLQSILSICVLGLMSQSCNDAYQPNNPDTALPPRGWENFVIMPLAQCNVESDYFVFTLASPYPLVVGFTQNNQIQINFECLDVTNCSITDPKNPACSTSNWKTSYTNIPCTIKNNLSEIGCTTAGCALNAGETYITCYQAGIANSCTNGIAGQRTCKVSHLPIGVSGFPHSISYDFQFFGNLF